MISPDVWSDFDGTAVEKLPMTNPRNWSKYPLRPMPGYVAFLTGVRETGAQVAGTVSRRPDIAVRRLATRASIARHGMSSFFPHRSRIVHAGSEAKKAEFLVDEAASQPAIGMIDDQPHKIGVALLESMIQRGTNSPSERAHIVLAAVDTEKSGERMERLGNHAADMAINLLRTTDTGMLIVTAGNSRLDVVQLDPYSYECGKEFGIHMVGTAEIASDHQG